MIKLTIADDHPMVITGLLNILRPYPHLEVIATYLTGAALLEGLKEQVPDVLILDLHLPDTTGNELARILKRQYPQLRILVVTSVDNPYHVRDLLQHGCLGYILKSAAPETVVAAIEQVYQGEEFLEPALQQQVLDSVLHPAAHKKARHVRLTKREQEILGMLCDGLSNYEIGDKLFLSHRTIENHRMSLYQKFDVKNTASLVKMALQLGLIK